MYPTIVFIYLVSIFKCMIYLVLGDLVKKYCIAYLDNILIFSFNIETNHLDVQWVLDRLEKHSLYLKKEKWKFFKFEVSFLENVIFKDGHAICPNKIKTINNWPLSLTFTDLRSFLGLVNFLQCFTPDLVSFLTFNRYDKVGVV